MQKVIRETVCDITGEPAVITMRFGLEDKVYEIDLAAEPAEELRHALAGFIESARPTGKLRAADGGRKSTSANALRQSREHNQAIRDWAKANGLSVSDRGRISAEIQEKFDAAHAPQSTSAPALA